MLYKLPLFVLNPLAVMYFKKSVKVHKLKMLTTVLKLILTCGHFSLIVCKLLSTLSQSVPSRMYSARDPQLSKLALTVTFSNLFHKSIMLLFLYFLVQFYTSSPNP